VLSVPFAAHAPDLELSVRTAEAPQLLQGLRNGELDIALTYVDDSVGEGLETHLLYRERMFFFTTAEVASTARLSWQQITAQPLCLLRSGFPASVAEHLSSATKVTYTDSLAVVAAHVRSGKWSTVLPQSLAASLAPSPNLRAIGIRKSAAEQANVGFVTQRAVPLPAPVHALMELAHTPDLVAEIRSMLSAHEAYLTAQ
jgi:DNA-binding transcriptional LysR family regulator